MRGDFPKAIDIGLGRPAGPGVGSLEAEGGGAAAGCFGWAAGAGAVAGIVFAWIKEKLFNYEQDLWSY